MRTIFLVVLGALLIFTTGAYSQRVKEGSGFPYDMENATVETSAVTGNIQMLTTAGGNIGVFAGEDGLFLVDDRFAPITGKIKAALAAITDQPVRFLINTHFHGDHTGGNELFGADGAIIVAHDNVRRTLSAPHFIEALQTTFEPVAAVGLPIITFNQDLTFHLNGEEVFVFHTPNAHTDGDSIIYFRGSDVVATGDVFQRLGFPIVDRGNGGSFQGLIAAWERILAEIGPETTILPGHGLVANRTAMESALSDLKTIRDRIAGAVADGKLAEETAALEPTADFGPGWPPRPLSRGQIVTWFYQELSE